MGNKTRVYKTTTKLKNIAHTHYAIEYTCNVPSECRGDKSVLNTFQCVVQNVIEDLRDEGKDIKVNAYLESKRIDGMYQLESDYQFDIKASIGEDGKIPVITAGALI